MIDVLVGSVLLFLAFYVMYIIYLVCLKISEEPMKESVRTLIVIGSGGHTLEMLQHVKTLNPKVYGPRLYIMADTDTSSEYKIKELETKFGSVFNSNYEIVKIPRSREVNQSYFTSIFTTIYSTVISTPIVFRFQPDLIICNGPGTCIPICLIGLLMNLIVFFNVKIVFIESICRVKTLSLSGKILLHLADVVIVQWEALQKKYPKTVYLGRLN